jgi:hypothetical protein
MLILTFCRWNFHGFHAEFSSIFSSIKEVVDWSSMGGVKYVRRNKRKAFMEVIFLETLKDIMVAFLDYFAHFSAGTRIRR